MIDLNAFKVGQSYECGSCTLKEAKDSIIENGSYEFEDRVRVKSFGNSVFDFYKDKIVRVK